MGRLENKVCFITASSTGIGLAIAKFFIREGAQVVISSRNEQNIQSALTEIKQLYKANATNIFGIKCHTGSKQDRTNAIQFIKDKFGRLDVLVCNSAVSTFFGNPLELSEAQMDKMYEINIKSTYFLICEAFSEVMEIKSKRPNVIIVSSYAGYVPDKTIGFYSITKTALLGMTKLFANSLQGSNARVNCIAPGVIKTKFSKGLWEKQEQQVMDMLNLNRLGEVEDIANCALYLASDESDYVNGETILVAGTPIARL